MDEIMIDIDNVKKRTWAEVNLNALEYNYDIIKKQLNKEVKVCCVVKANAYGHGAVQLAKFYEKLGADWFAVSNIEEAIQLRKAGITRFILILGYTPVQCVGEIYKYDITQCVYSYEYGMEMSAEAIKKNIKIKVHIKIDTGMGRIGFQYRNIQQEDTVLNDIYRVCCMEGLIPEGIFTHFAIADSGEDGKKFTWMQYRCFEDVIRYLAKKKIDFKFKHCANSAAILDYPEFSLNMVRAGIGLYGLNPSNEIRNMVGFKPAMTLKTVISNIKEIGPGDSIGYGRKYIANKEMKIATIPIGYADGFWRSNFSNGTKVLVHNEKVDIIGRVCMDQTIIDISGLNDISIGEEVVIFGEEPALTAEEIAKINQTIGYEILCAVGLRVPRVYIYNNKVVGIQDEILG